MSKPHACAVFLSPNFVGKDRVNVVPTFTSLSTLMVPPIASTMEKKI